MVNNFELSFPATAFTFTSGEATPDQIPTTLKRCVAFDPSVDEFVIIEGVVPAAFTGSGTLKLDAKGAANTTTATHDLEFDVVTEFRTPHVTAGNNEPLNVDNFDGTPDTGNIVWTDVTAAFDPVTMTITLTPAVTPAVGDLFRIKITRDISADDLATDFLLTDLVFREEV